MNVNVPAIAPPVPPDTGASMHAMLLLAAFWVTLREVLAAMVLQSITSVPAGSAASKPGCVPSPQYSASTCWLAGNMLMTTCAPATASSADVAMRAPASPKGLQAAGVKSKPTTVWPALCKLSAMGAPMLPKPMNAMFMTVLRFMTIL